jgi:hypothetical protein
MMLEEIEMLCQSNKIRKHSRTRGLSMDEEAKGGVGESEAQQTP